MEVWVVSRAARICLTRASMPNAQPATTVVARMSRPYQGSAMVKHAARPAAGGGYMVEPAQTRKVLIRKNEVAEATAAARMRSAPLRLERMAPPMRQAAAYQ